MKEHVIKIIEWIKSLNTPSIRIVRKFDDREYHFYADYTSREDAEEEIRRLIGHGKGRNYVCIKVGKKFVAYFEEKDKNG